MGRPAQPLAMAKLKGAHKKNPQRFRKAMELEEDQKAAAAKGQPAPSVSPLGLIPEHLSDEAKKAWFELETYIPPGILSQSDRILLELTANMLGEYRRSPSRFATNKLPMMLKYLAHLGLTPTDRRKLALPEGGSKNPFDAFKAPGKTNA